MQFLYPNFLFALVAIAIPIVIHLFNFRRHKKFTFSNIRFLKQVVEQNNKQQKLKSLLVLFCRVLIIAFLVIAFAQPYIPYKKNLSQQKEKIVSIFIDNSYSMSAIGKAGELLEAAKNKAIQIADVYKNDCQFQLLTNDFEGKHQRLLSKQDCLLMIDGVKLSATSKNYNQIISRQSQAMTSNGAQKISYIISDFQETQFNISDDKTDTSFQIKFVPIDAPKQQNVFIDSAWVISPIIKPNTTVILMVRLRNESSDMVENQPVILKINGIQKALQNYTCAAHSFVDVEMQFTCDNKSYQNGELSIIDNPITFDDKLYFTIKPKRQTEVLIINDKAPNNNITNLYKVDDYYKVWEQNIKQIDYSAFKNKQLIILNEPENISSGLIDEIKKQLLSGAYVFIIPPSNPTFINGINTLAASFSGINYIGPYTQELLVDKMNTKDDLLKDVFTSLPQNIDAPSVHRYYQLSTSSNTKGAAIFSINNDLPFIFKSSVGKGKIFYAACAFTNEFTSFQKHSFFVPFMLKIGLGKMQQSALYYTIGGNKYVEYISDAEDKIGHISKTNFDMVADIINTDNNKQIFVDEQIKEAGIYDIKSSNNALLAQVAFNYNRTESYTKNLALNNLEKLNPSGEIITEDIHVMKNKIALEEYGKPYWHYALWLCLLFILAEILLLKFLK